MLLLFFCFRLFADYTPPCQISQRNKLSTGAHIASFCLRWYLAIMVSKRQSRKFKFYIAKNIQMNKEEKLREIIKPKPRFMPKKLWKFLINMLLDLS